MGIVQSLFGGPKPPLQPKGPAPFAQPDERDREALFWDLKWSTSYTAIEHNAKLWAQFATEWEKWLRSQDDPYEHLVETLKYIFDDQIYYERGLKRLRQGDRSVFDRRSSEGWLAKINTGLVSRRMEWYAPPDFIAQQWNCPESMVRLYLKAHEATMKVASDSGGYTGSRFGEVRTLLKLMSPPHTLPEPRWDVSFAPGKRAPKDGIYEQVDENGHIVSGMGYFIKGVESEKEDWLEYGPLAGPNKTNAFIWRLLWEDTRYKDGKIPEEEQHYPTPEQSLELAKQPPAEDLRLRCDANEPCPREGYWFTPAQAGSRRFFKAGEVMPEFKSDYGATIWQWDQTQAP